jgi:hypothetical protein
MQKKDYIEMEVSLNTVAYCQHTQSRTVQFTIPATFLSPRPANPFFMIFVYSLGGSILAGRDAHSLREYAQALKQLAQEHKIFVGGGRIAREYIEKARALGASERYRDEFDEAVQEAP